MMIRSCITGALAAAVVLAGLTGCSGSQNAGDAPANAGGAPANAGKSTIDPNAAIGQQLAALQRAHPVIFPPRSADLSSQDTQIVQQAAAVLKSAPAGVTVTTHAGYADAQQAQQLSEQRADAIAKALEAGGVDHAHIKTQPTGNTDAQGEQALQAQITSP